MAAAMPYPDKCVAASIEAYIPPKCSSRPRLRGVGRRRRPTVASSLVVRVHFLADARVSPAPHPRITRAPHRSRGYSATLLDTPRRFYAALRASRVPNVEASFGDETRLILYALQSQAERGPCEPRSKWGMAAEDRAKHETWANLGKMEPFEAMRLFVKLLDDERPGWWKEDAGAPGGGTSASVRAGPGGAAETDTRREEETRVIVSPVRAVARNHSRARESRAAPGGDDSRDDDDDEKRNAWVSNLKRGVWVTNPGSKMFDPAPPPRYRHASCVLGDELLVFGGADARGRLCKGADLFFVLNARTGAWRSVATRRARPCAGARLVVFDGNAYLVGGEVEKPDDDDDDDDDDDAFLDVSRIDFSTDASTGSETATFVALNATAAAGTRKPRRRRGHTATVVPGTDTLVVFGGEDDSRRFLNDARVLDMRALTWRTAYEGESAPAGFFGGLFFGAVGGKTPEDPRAPAPRAEHVAAAIWARNDAFEETGETGETRETLDEDEDDASVSKKRSAESGPGPRADSARATLLVLGGAGASGACFDDAYALDLVTGRWTVLALDAYATPADGADGPDGILHTESSGVHSHSSKPGPARARATRRACSWGGTCAWWAAETIPPSAASTLRRPCWTCARWRGSRRSARSPRRPARARACRCVPWSAEATPASSPSGDTTGRAAAKRTRSACPRRSWTATKAGEQVWRRGLKKTRPLVSRVGRCSGGFWTRDRDPRRLPTNARAEAEALPSTKKPPRRRAESRFSRRITCASGRRTRGSPRWHRVPRGRARRCARAREASEKRAAEADAALAEARRAIAALETSLSAERASRENERDLAAKELEASQKKAAEWRAKAGGGEEQETTPEEEESDEEEEDPESRRGWLFGL